MQVASVRLQTLMHPSQLAETPKGQRSWTEVTFDDLKYKLEEGIFGFLSKRVAYY